MLIVSERGRYCNKGVDIFRRMRVNLLVDGSFDNSHIPAQLGDRMSAGVSRSPVDRGRVAQSQIYHQQLFSETCAAGLHEANRVGLAESGRRICLEEG